jgi:hypothetical protein
MAWHAASLDIFTRLYRVTDVYLASAEADQAAKHAAARGAAKALVDAFGVKGSPLDAPPSPGAIEVRVLTAVRQTLRALHPAGSPEERRAAALAAYRSLLSLYSSGPFAPPLDARSPTHHDFLRHRAPSCTRGLLLTDGDEELAASLELLDELVSCLVRLHGAENASALADFHRQVAARLRDLAGSDDSGELRPCYATALVSLIPEESQAASPSPPESVLEASRALLRRAVALMCRHVARDVLDVGCRQEPLRAPAVAKGAGQAAAADAKPAIAVPAMRVKMEESGEGPDDETGDLDDQGEGTPPIVAMFVNVAKAFEALGGESELARAWASAARQAAALEPDDEQERLTLALARTADFGLKDARGRKRRAAAEEAGRNVRRVIAANWEKLLKRAGSRA